MPAKNSYNCMCIDGSVHGCGVCKGYCSFREHPGYLTQKHIASHRCLEKGCYYFVQKEKRQPIQKPVDKSDKLMRTAAAATTHMEGLKVLRAENTGLGHWTVYYIAIANYVVDEIEKAVSSACGETICFRKLPYSFDNAVKLIMG